MDEEDAGDVPIDVTSDKNLYFCTDNFDASRKQMITNDLRQALLFDPSSKKSSVTASDGDLTALRPDSPIPPKSRPWKSRFTREAGVVPRSDADGSRGKTKNPFSKKNRRTSTDSGPTGVSTAEKMRRRAPASPPHFEFAKDWGNQLPEWMPDEQVTHCMSPSCKVVFTTFRRRHHCRLCGNIFCSRCCGNLMLIENLYKDVQRVCNICFNRVTKRQRERKQRRTTRRESSLTTLPESIPSRRYSHSSSSIAASGGKSSSVSNSSTRSPWSPERLTPGNRTPKRKLQSVSNAYLSITEITQQKEPPLPRRKLATSNPSGAPTSPNALSQSMPSASFSESSLAKRTAPISRSSSGGRRDVDVTSPYATTTMDDSVDLAAVGREHYGLHEVQSCYMATNSRPGSPPKAESRAGRSSFVLEPVSEYRPQIKNWNTEFQAAMELTGDEKYAKLTCLADDFASTAITYAKVIISELCFPEDQKTIQTSTDMGGTAGGAKYVVQGIMFKVALDTKLSAVNDIWMYGGHECQDEYAMKAASKELLGLSWCYNAVSDTEIDGLHFPLMAVIDYKGFRVIAVSVLPLNSSTLRYGSDDGGVTVFSAIPALNEKMSAVGRYLKLKPHKVGLRVPKTIYGPGDIEGHLGEDGLFYVVDFARMMPPEAPTCEDGLQIRARCVFYQYLRPEYVSCIQRKPLCSDAFTGWDLNSESPETNSKEVRLATEHVYDVLIPAFAKKLMAQLAAMQDYLEMGLHERLDLVGSSALHPKGLNIRHLGRIRSHATDDRTRRLILSVCVGRTLKQLVNEKMRRKMREIQVPAEEPFKQVVLDFLNKVVSRDPRYDSFWTAEMKEKLRIAFPFALTEEEKGDADLRPLVNMKLVIVQILVALNARLAPRARRHLEKADLSDFDSAFFFVPGDISELIVRVKQLPIISWCAAMDARAKAAAHAKSDGCNPRELKRLHAAACSWFEKTIYQHPYSPNVSLHCGASFLELARLTRNPVKQDALFRKAYIQFGVTYKDSGVPYGASLRQWAAALREHADIVGKRGDKDLQEKLLAEAHSVEEQLQYEMIKSTDLSKLI